MKQTILIILFSAFLLSTYSTNVLAERNHHRRGDHYNYDDNYYDDYHIFNGNAPEIRQMTNQQIMEMLERYRDTGYRPGRHKSRVNVHSVKHILMSKTALNLSDNQIDKLRAIELKSKKETIRLEAEQDILLIELKELLHAEKPDRKKISDLLDKSSSIQTDLRKISTFAILDAFELMDETQIEKLKKGKSKHSKKMKNHHDDMDMDMDMD